MNVSRTVLAVFLVLAGSVVPVGTAVAANQQANAYAGTHVSFEAHDGAVVDYAVDDETVLQSVAVQSQSDAESNGDADADVGLSAVTAVTGSGLSVDSRTSVGATVTAENGATMQAHDDPRGILVVRSGGNPRYVTANVSSSTRTEQASEKRVVVTTDDGTEGTFIVVGDGDVTVNDRGNVSADLGSDGTLVFRSYPDGRDETAAKQERLIADGTATAEVYVMRGSDASGELAADVVDYGQQTSVDVTEKGEGTVRMTVDRSRHEGTVVITSVSESAMESVEDLSVTVDGDAAARASSYGELRSATSGDTSKFLVRQQSSADANADVLVAVNHFSTREITMTRSDSSESDSGSDDVTATDSSESDSGSDDVTATDSSESGSSGGDAGGSAETTSFDSPGFGVGVAVVALLAAALYARRRR
ncbi:MAG: PGF-CTERM sorting domain-containing protein [Haloplanus sp.]